MDQRGRCFAPVIEVDDRGQRLVLDGDRIGDVLGLGAGRRHRDRHLLAGIADLAPGEHRKIGRLESGERRGGADRLDVGHVGRREHLPLGALGRRHRQEPPVGNRRPVERRVPHAGDLDIRGELPGAHEEPVIFLARDARADAAVTQTRLP